MSAQDYYRTLGVDKTATPDQIKKAYRKLAMKWHPDRNPDDKANAETKFKEIGEAYSVLSDEQKRKNYDQFGTDKAPNFQSSGFPNHRQSGQSAPGQGPFTFQNAEDLFQQFSFHFGDGNASSTPFGAFSGHNGYRNGSNGMALKGDTVRYEVGVTLEELYCGRTKTMRITRKRVDRERGCTHDETKTLSFEIKRGWKSGTTVTFEGEGDEAINVRPGDVQFVIAERKHAVFGRRGHDLVKTQRVTLKQALMGVEVKVSTLDGRTLRVPVTERTIYHGFKHRVRGEGMPVKNTDGRRFGDLVIEFEVEFPERLSREQKEAIARCL